MTNNTHISQWEQFLAVVKDNIPEAQFEAWFKPLEFRGYSSADGMLSIKAPSAFFYERLEQVYKPLVWAALKKVFGQGIERIKYLYDVVKDPETEVAETKQKPTAAVNRKPSLNPFDHKDYPAFDSQLIDRLNFDNYCCSKSNQLAVTIGKTIAEKPDCKTFNPMFLFGSTGVGKTQLVQAIGLKIKENNPAAKVLYVSARVFESQYTTAVRENNTNNFIGFYQNIDVLIIDDIQSLVGKTGTQNTFFFIFEHLRLNNKQLIITCDRRPADLDGMEERLMSRFKCGITIEIEKPDYELRRNVLMMKAASDGYTLPDDVLEFIAENVTESVRELEGIVVSLFAHAMVLNMDVNIDLARIVISNAVKISKKQVTFELITECVCDFYNLDQELLYSKTRKREISDARQLVMFLAKKYTQLSSINIGQRLKRDHATVLHSWKAVEERMSVDRDFRAEVEKIESILKQ